MRCPTAFLGVVLGATACNTTNKDSGAEELNTEPESFYPSTLSPGATVSLSSCTAGVSESDINKTVAIVFDMEQSYHEATCRLTQVWIFFGRALRCLTAYRCCNFFGRQHG